MRRRELINFLKGDPYFNLFMIALMTAGLMAIVTDTFKITALSPLFFVVLIIIFVLVFAIYFFILFEMWKVFRKKKGATDQEQIDGLGKDVTTPEQIVDLEKKVKLLENYKEKLLEDSSYYSQTIPKYKEKIVLLNNEKEAFEAGPNSASLEKQIKSAEQECDYLWGKLHSLGEMIEETEEQIKSKKRIIRRFFDNRKKYENRSDDFKE